MSNTIDLVSIVFFAQVDSLPVFHKSIVSDFFISKKDFKNIFKSPRIIKVFIVIATPYFEESRGNYCH